ncbi:hypothetical protein KY290_005517 [Solanum tuberosum]|uniref:Uncharacterized protein n=1 Tax=Solanum tuberosum TaxID=4113 RepID=A0ABQ7WES8_SOLTU|nr:hypothetical protein KY289_005903 [Solanum tuberosum]KAH0779090.1 hypothetical protein KY290_005517 [Solanum tuberosum]
MVRRTNKYRRDKYGHIEGKNDVQDANPFAALEGEEERATENEAIKEKEEITKEWAIQKDNEEDNQDQPVVSRGKEDLILNIDKVAMEGDLSPKQKGERLQLWESLETIASSTSLPWLVGGDFNMISNVKEKLGGCPVVEREVEDFNHCINVCNLEDQKFKGSKYTWWNGRTDEDCIFKRQDRLLCNDGMQNIFLVLEMEHLEIITLEEVIKVQEAQFERVPSVTNRENLRKSQVALKKKLHREEEFWKQKAGMQWFKEGERNTKFFHTIVKGRRSRLRVNQIQNNEGEWLEDQEDIEEATIEFYRRQFTK